ncbi:DNA polymerase III subunit delta [Macrococcus lamae]|uniref:DNA polymerase III subunit delta n=1 Tax=Macrococcus lamae TaxID=198484 RepID=A0A4R6BX74_9STAP|nr:DNA polymerase III subunit delta [Macrococcus lamae]TDM13092.1 DNA polymerase III subunit delta [Macrococcus lamae]
MKLKFNKGAVILKAITLNYGAVPELTAKKTQEMVDKLLPEKDDFNFSKYDMQEIAIQTIIEDAMTIPFLSDYKVIVVKNSFIFTGDKTKTTVEHHIEALVDFIERFEGPNFVIFEVNNEKLDERKKIVKLIKKQHDVNKIEAMDEAALKQWIKKSLNEQFKDIKQDALDELIQLTGADYKLITSELEKLLLYIGDEPIIVLSHIKAIVSRSLEQNVFLLTDYITTNRKKEAVTLLHDLIHMKEEPIKLLALISGQYRLFYQAKILNQKGFSEAQIAKTLKTHPYRVKLAIRKTGRMDLGDILSTMEKCTAADYQLKSSYMDKVLILELFILSI